VNNRPIRIVLAIFVASLISIASIYIYRMQNQTPESPNGSYNFTSTSLDSLTISLDDGIFVYYKRGKTFDKGSIRDLEQGNYYLDGQATDYLFEIRESKVYQLIQISPTQEPAWQLKQISSMPTFIEEKK
jgi:hypothetical protein